MKNKILGREFNLTFDINFNFLLLPISFKITKAAAHVTTESYKLDDLYFPARFEENQKCHTSTANPS
jgi:hypothetical protein